MDNRRAGLVFPNAHGGIEAHSDPRGDEAKELDAAERALWVRDPIQTSKIKQRRGEIAEISTGTA